MPLYEYQCDACGERFEVIQKFSDKPIEVCQKCGKGPVRKLMSSPAIQFKGSGWYITDYARKDSAPAAKTDSGSSSGSSSDTSEKKTEKSSADAGSSSPSASSTPPAANPPAKKD